MRGRFKTGPAYQGVPALAVVVASLILPACPPDSPAVAIDSGEVVRAVRAVRGHEVVVAKGGKNATVRLVGLYTFPVWPRENTDISDYASKAVEFVESSIKGKNVRLVLERPEPDPRGRYLGFLELDGVDINQRLIEKGLAAVYTEFPFSREQAYFAAEGDSRKARQGLWQSGHAAKRVMALRETWAAVRQRNHNDKVVDPLSSGAP